MISDVTETIKSKVFGSESAPSLPSKPRSARWVPWLLLLLELAITVVVIGILSVVIMVQLTLTPGAVFGEFDDILTWSVSMGITAGLEVFAAAVFFVLTGVVVAILGLPIRLIGPLRRAWLGNGEVTLAGVALGVLTIVAAYVFGTWGSVEGLNGPYPIYNPSPWPLLVGWFVLAFSLSMLVWPVRWMRPRMRSWWTETQLTKRVKPSTSVAA